MRIQINYRGHRIIGRPGAWEVFDTSTGTIWLGETRPDSVLRELLFFSSIRLAMQAIRKKHHENKS